MIDAPDFLVGSLEFEFSVKMSWSGFQGMLGGQRVDEAAEVFPDIQQCVGGAEEPGKFVRRRGWDLSLIFTLIITH